MEIANGGTTPDARDALRDPGEPRRSEGLRVGLTIVALVSLILSLNWTAESMFTRPFAGWLARFLEALWTNFVVGLGILLAAVWARQRHPGAGRRQYAIALAAVTVATLLAALAFEVDFRIFCVILLAAIWVRRYPGRAQYGGALVAAVLAVGLASITYAPEIGRAVADPWISAMMGVGQDLMRYAVVGIVIAGAWLYTRTEADHAAAIAQCSVDSARMDEQTAQARLQMLEAQIEPHFLFNTLAHVRRLYETDREAGARMLGNLEAYLAVALPQMRTSDSTLGRELDHVGAYLDIQQIRMGRRLAYSIDVDDALRGARLPPLMLLTLVENAIKHGLGPVPVGGRIDIRAAVEGGRLRVTVADTGGGFTKSGGGGAGLANIRARLAAKFGQEAGLALAPNSPTGVVATIALPYQQASATR